MDYGRAETAAPGPHLAVRATSRLTRGCEPPTPTPFGGTLTNELLAALPGPDFARLLSYLEPVSLVSGHYLYEFGEDADFAYFPETAVVSNLYFLEDGGTAGAAIVGREGMVGLSAIFGSRPPSYWTQVTVGGCSLRVEAGVIRREFARCGALQQLLLRYTSARLAQLSQRAVCNGRHKLDARLCTWLLMIHDRVREEQLPLTHEDIARHIGTRRAGITTSCNSLRGGGAIDYRRGRIRILDRPALEGAACECYRALRRLAE